MRSTSQPIVEIGLRSTRWRRNGPSRASMGPGTIDMRATHHNISGIAHARRVDCFASCGDSHLTKPRRDLAILRGSLSTQLAEAWLTAEVVQWNVHPIAAPISASICCAVRLAMNFGIGEIRTGARSRAIACFVPLCWPGGQPLPRCRRRDARPESAQRAWSRIGEIQRKKSGRWAGRMLGRAR